MKFLRMTTTTTINFSRFIHGVAFGFWYGVMNGNHVLVGHGISVMLSNCQQFVKPLKSQ